MERPHPRVRWLWIGRSVFAATVAAAVGYFLSRYLVGLDPRHVAALWLVLAVLGVGHAVLYYRSWRFEIQTDALYLVRGVVTEVETSVPFVRVQHVDTQRRPITRAAGLSKVVVYTAGTRGADITVPGLRPERATELREQLRELAGESERADAV